MSWGIGGLSGPMDSGRWAGAVDPYLCSHGVIKLCDGRGRFSKLTDCWKIWFRGHSKF